MVKDSKDQTHLAAESSTHASQFPMLQSLTRSAYNSKEESNRQEVIKSESQSDTEKYQDPCTKSRDIDSTDPQSSTLPPPLINTTILQCGPKKPSLFENMFISHALTKVMEIKLLNGPED